MRSILIAILLSALSVSADERPYTRWFVVAYFDGIDKPYKYVAKPFTNSTECGDRENEARIANRIPKHVTVGCKIWTAKPGDKS